MATRSPAHRHAVARTRAGHRRLADLAEGLGEAQLAVPSLCEAWSVRDVLGHLVMTLEIGTARFLLEVARDRGRAARTSQRLATSYGARSAADLAAALRRGAERELAPPGIGPMGPMADACIHLRDVAVPLGLATTAPVADWHLVLDFLLTPRARSAGFLPRGRLDGLALRAEDTGTAGSPLWTHGSGPAVTGPAESIVLAVTGRAVGLQGLRGDGVDELARRLRAA